MKNVPVSESSKNGVGNILLDLADYNINRNGDEFHSFYQNTINEA